MESAENTQEEAPPPARRARWQTHPRLRRGAVVATIAAAAAFAFAMLLTRFHVLERPAEQSFGAAAGDARIGVYLQPIVIDAVNESMQIRVSVTGSGASAVAADKDLVLIVRHGAETERIPLSRDQPRPEKTLALDLDGGSVHDYPLDAYKAKIALSAAEAGSDAALPVRVTSWEVILHYTVRAHPITASRPNEVGLLLDVHRTGAVRFFGIAAYGAMMVMAFSALTIGVLVFLGTRKIEVTLVGAIGAIVFALPALRNALPGTPPLGVFADILVFFWAELSAVVALGLFVTAWAGRGPQP